MSVYQVALLDRAEYWLWSDTLLIPVYVTFALLVLHGFIALWPYRKGVIFFWDYDASTPPNPATPRTTPSQFDEANPQIRPHGMMVTVLDIFGLLSTLTLVGLTTVALLVFEKEHALGTSNENGSSNEYYNHERIETTYIALYAYASLLALTVLLSKGSWGSAAKTHLTLIMLTILAVYAYRDLYPLTTFTLVPKDAFQGWTLWSRIFIVSFVAVLIPLVTPRVYKPVDPSRPSQDINPEQTASWLSFLTYTFLDPVIWLAARSPHLPYERLPPLADSDRAEYLTAKSGQLLDPILQERNTHITWGILRVFGWEFVQLGLMVILRSTSNFMAPLGVKGLLKYLETEGKNATIRPWVWVLWLFLGPFIGCIAIQYYTLLTTRMMVHAECIITQLVFDHALRMRMKEEVELSSAPITVTSTPETRSIVGSEDQSESTNSGEETLQGNGNASTTSSVTKGKVNSTGNANAAPAVMPPDPNGAKPRAEAKATNLVGKINNLVTTDLGNIVDGRDILWLAFYGPLQFILCVWFLYAHLGWSAFIGMAVMAVTTPIPGYIAKLLNSVQSERMKKTDARVQTVTEILSVIRMTKLFGWEEKVNARIAEKRETELRWLKRRQLLGLLNETLTFIFPLLTMLATFATYTLIQKKQLTASTVFSSMTVFKMLRGVVRTVFLSIPEMINAKVSLGRLNDFLLKTELLDRFTHEGNTQELESVPPYNIPENNIGFRNAAFTWSHIVQGDESRARRCFRLCLQGDLFFQPRSLNLVVGPTGSGKTSLLMALLGEMHFEPDGENAGFNLPRHGGIAYAAQESWVQNETIKENILFGKPYEQGRYEKVIYQCGLERDLSLFEAGDETEVGEKGLTLSGGQKARVTLARAVYSYAEIVLLDDILAALDVHTAKFVVDKCLQGDLLEGRTTIIVTHNVTMLTPIAKFVVSLGLDGRIVSQGSVSDALARDHTFLEEVTEVNKRIEKAAGTIDSIGPEKKGKRGDGKLTVSEEVQLGHVSWSAVKTYIGNLGDIPFWIVFPVSVVLAELMTSLSTWFLGYWASQYDGNPTWAVPVAWYLSVYALILVSIMVFSSLAASVFVFGSIKASRTLHQKLVESVLGTTLRWIDTIPTARIITRCTQDIRAVDGPIPEMLREFISATVSMSVQFAAVVFFVPVFILPGIAVLLVGYLVGQLYMKAQLPVKREMSNHRSIVLSHFGAATHGLISIRAYGAQAAFRTESLKRIDEYSRPARISWNCNRWICVRIDAIGGLFASGLGAYLVYGKRLRTASDTGFSLAMAVGFSTIILWWVRLLNAIEVRANSLERIEDYVKIEQEPKATESGKPPAYWPASGDLTVTGLSARYSADGPKVLDNISFQIKSGERIGVVGRTGSGKSSLTLSLLRCIPTEGNVTLDGLPIHSINLDALRSSITIIPQQPELLSGTLRENLDPFSEHSDATLNDALRAAGLFNLQGENDATQLTLDSELSSRGGNLSVGQRQILALARAIVRQSKLLILDEATSAIDYATDTIIQKTLEEVLHDATLIIVAHRLQTIMNSDRIIVLDAGKLVEFDSPANLLGNKDGYLRSLVDESGDRELLYKMAKKGKGYDE